MSHNETGIVNRLVGCRYRGKGDPPQDCDYPTCGCDLNTAPSTASGGDWLQRLSVPASAETDQRLNALREAMEAIQRECGMCDGHGFTVEVRSISVAEHDPACDGSCRNCPIEVEGQEQYQEPCEYCGRPIGVIAELIGSVTPVVGEASPLNAQERSAEEQIIELHQRLLAAEAENKTLKVLVETQAAYIEAAEQERDAYRRDFNAELDGNAAIRKMFGARDDESFFAFIQRLASAEHALAALRESQKEKDLTRSDQPQLRAGESDPRGDQKAESRPSQSQEWEPSGKCQYDTCDGQKFDWDSTDSRFGSWFCVKCGGMQLPPDVTECAIVPAPERPHDAELLAKIDRAHEELCEATKRQMGRRTERRTFRISIPANPDRDTDLIIGDALRSARAFIAGTSPSLAALQETNEEKDLGGHESHGGRDDLEPAARPQLSHDAIGRTPEWRENAFAGQSIQHPRGYVNDVLYCYGGCGTQYRDFPCDTLLPTPLWNRIAIGPPFDHAQVGIEREGRGGVLCPSCIIQRLVALPECTAVFADIEDPRALNTRAEKIDVIAIDKAATLCHIIATDGAVHGEFLRAQARACFEKLQAIALQLRANPNAPEAQ